MSGTPPHVPYKIRLDNGSEVLIPSASVLAGLVGRGDIRADTVIYDAGRGTWCRAGEAAVVKFIVEELGRERPELLAHWTSDVATQSQPKVSGLPLAPLTKMATPGVMPARTTPLSAPATSAPAPAAAAPAASPKPEAPKPVQPMSEASRPSQPKIEKPVTAAPKGETPVAAPPKVETAVAAQPKVEAPVAPQPTAAVNPTKPKVEASTPTQPKVVASSPPQPKAAPSAPTPMKVEAARPTQPKPETSTPAQPKSESSTTPQPKVASSTSVPVQPKKPEPPPPVEASQGVNGGSTPVESGAEASGSPRAFTTKRIFAASFVAAAAAVVGLGFFIRGRDSGSEQAMRPVRSLGASNTSYQLVQLREQQLSQIGLAVDTGISHDSTLLERPPLPIFRKPKVALLTDEAIGSDAEGSAASFVSDASVDLPAPLRPERVDNASEVPYDVAPQVRNANQVRLALEREYPIGLREVGVGGRIEMSFFIDARGVVERFEVKESSGNRALDQAALRVAQVFQFSPARRRNETVPATISLGITFDSGNGAPAATAQPNASASTPVQDSTARADDPVAAPYDVAPQVRNANQIREALAREYPIGLRDSGVGGRVEMWFHVNERGVVEEFKIKQSSGNTALDRAALRVARAFQFSPALLAGQPVSTWVSLGITFEGK